MQLLRNLQEYEVSKTKADGASRAKKKMASLVKELNVGDGPELSALIKTKNLATGGMFMWCEATLKCYDIYKNVEPLKASAKKMAMAKEQGEKELAETEALLAALNASLSELNSNKKLKQDELDELERKSNEMTRKLNAASQLINGLGSEQVRWTADMGIIKDDKIMLVGDCLTGSAFLSYCGPFNSLLRQKMIFQTWK
jgi:dynein heavy chain